MSISEIGTVSSQHILGPLSDTVEGVWTVIATRHQSNMMESWPEYLCARSSEGVVLVGICLPEPLQEFSVEDWEDEEGESEGEAFLPAFVSGKPAYGEENGYIIGSFIVLPSEDEVVISDLRPEAIDTAVREAGWVDPDAEILKAIATFGRQAPNMQVTTKSAIPKAVIGAYLSTRYKFGPALEHELRIGEHSRAAAELMAEHHTDTAVYITAWNPEGRSLSIEENARRQASLRWDIENLGLVSLNGKGVGINPHWPPEESVFVISCTLDQVVHLGHHYRQNAVVWLGADAVPKLLMLR